MVSKVRTACDAEELLWVFVERLCVDSIWEQPVCRLNLWLICSLMAVRVLHVGAVDGCHDIYIKSIRLDLTASVTLSSQWTQSFVLIG